MTRAEYFLRGNIEALADENTRDGFWEEIKDDYIHKAIYKAMMQHAIDFKNWPQSHSSEEDFTALTTADLYEIYSHTMITKAEPNPKKST